MVVAFGIRVTEFIFSSNSSKWDHAKSMVYLPSRSHGPIVHCVAKTTNIINDLWKIYKNFVTLALCQTLHCLALLMFLAYTFVRHNFTFWSFTLTKWNVYWMLQMLPKLFVLCFWSCIVIYHVFDTFLFHHLFFLFCALFLACDNNNN